MATKLYDAIVSSDGKSDYLLASTAFAAGNVSVFIRKGTYTETANIVIPGGGQLIGETRGGVTISFAGTSFGIVCDSAPPTIQTAGTISTTNASPAIVGTGTSFTSLVVGDYIAVGTVFAKITTITDDTHLTIASTYEGTPLINASYQALAMLSGVSIVNIGIAGSTGTGLYFRGCRKFYLEAFSVSSCTPNIYLQNSGNGVVQELLTFNSTGDGYGLSNCISINNSDSEVVNNTGNGISLTNNNFGVLFDNTETSGNSGNGFNVTDTATDTNVSNCVSKYNSGYGFYGGSSSYGMTINTCNMSWNGSDGSNLSSNDVIFTSNLVQNNAGNGLVLNGIECTVTGNVCKNNGGDSIQVSGSNNVISSNICRNSGGYGCNVIVGAVNNIVSVNNLTYANFGTINDNGTNTIVTDNQA
jgi:hypothetical protein